MSDVCAKAINEFQTVINCNSIENASNTPDFILAEFLGDCLDAFKTASNKREKWYGVALEPGKDNGAPSIQATNNARDKICPHYHREYSVSEELVGEFGIGICNCDGQTSPIA